LKECGHKARGPKIDNQKARVEVSKLPQREISEMKENKIHEDKSPISCEKKHEKKKKKSEQATAGNNPNSV
jgi:hypothetical protein